MKKYLLVILSVFALAYTTYAQSGDIDLSFNPTNIGFGNGDGANNTVYTTSIQNDGKIIIGGSFTSYNGTTRNYISRMNADASLDGTFNPGTGANSTVRTTSVQSDGKIIIGGEFTSYNGITINCIARLNTNGTLDGTFNPGTGANNIILNTSIQSDGKIIIGGWFTSYNGTARNYIARLNADGTLDATFNPGIGANGYVDSTSIQSDGKIIIGGDFTSYNGTARNRITRLNVNGGLDLSFNPGTGVNGYVYTTCIQSDGKIIIGGDFFSYNGTGTNRIVRVNTSGIIDGTFNSGAGANSTVLSTSIQSDGKIIISGAFTNYNLTTINRIARLNADGSLDSTFNPAAGANSDVQIAYIQSDGQLIIGGSFTTYNLTARNRIARLNVNGTLDLSFNPDTEANNTVRSTSIQSDGKIIIGGAFTSYNGILRNRIARLNTNGNLDSTFNPGSGVSSTCHTTSIQSDGKIIIGGLFTSYNGTARNRIARLNTDGTLDSSFNPGTGVEGGNGTVYTTSIQSDGKIIIGGDFSTFNGTARNGIARLNVDGALDGTFNPGTGAFSILTTSIQSDGKIIIGGAFSTFNGTPRNSIARLNANGTLDNTFNPGTAANNTVYTTSIQSDGKIIIGGLFTSFNGTLRNRIARLNVDGTLDSTFNPGTGATGSFDNYVYTSSIQSDGKIIIGGDFTSYNGTARSKIARVNTNGNIDLTFNPGTGANNDVRTTSIQSDGQVIIGGSFTSYNGTRRNRVTRINGNVPLVIPVFEKQTIVIYPNPSNGVFTIKTNTISSKKNIFVYTLLGQKIYNKEITANETTIDISGQPKGIYLYKMSGENSVVKIGKLIVE